MRTGNSEQMRPGGRLWLLLAIVAILTTVRLIGLKLSEVDLFFDEAQYWVWSREPAFGYFSKPPLLAWIIAAASHVCGDAEACLRAPAPILYAGTSLLVYAIARTIYDEKAAFWAALLMMLAPGVAFSARIISTDVPLLFLWALALLAYVRLLRAADLSWAAVLGVALGLGLLAKYAMIYFVLGMGLAAAFDEDARKLLATPALRLAIAVAAIIFAPNILWNVQHGLVTFRHTGEDVTSDEGLQLDPLRAFEFVLSQFGVIGPVVFAVLLLAIAQVLVTSRRDRLMLAFAIVPLAAVTAAGFVTHARANWAAPAAISAFVVVADMLVRRQAWTWLTASVGLGGIAQLALLVADANATRVGIPLVPASKGEVYQRTIGWRAMAEGAGRTARQAGIATIVGEMRGDVASLLYYWRDQPETILAWPGPGAPAFEMTRPLTQVTPGPILFVSECPDPMRLAAYYGSVEPLAGFKVPLGPTLRRTYVPFRLMNPRGVVGPLAPCPW